MANSITGKPVEVNVYAHPAGAPQEYTLDWRFQGEAWQGNTDIVLPRGSGSHDITFTLNDNSGKGLRFKSDPAKAMWTRRGNGYPNGKGSGKGQITYKSVSNGGMTLDVNDDNSGSPARLRYMLRFDPDPNVFDPDIRNGGGGGFVRTETMLATAAGAAVGAAAMLAMDAAATAPNIAIGAAVGAVIGFVLWLIVEGVRETAS